MNGMTTIKIELGIDARHILQQVQLYNKTIEEQVQRGVELALEELADTDKFALMIKDAVIKDLLDVTHRAVASYEMRDKVAKALNDRVNKRLEEYADQLADKIIAALK